MLKGANQDHHLWIGKTNNKNKATKKPPISSPKFNILHFFFANTLEKL